MNYRIRTLSLITLAISALLATDAAAQPLGTFRWQLLPYCNVVTVHVTAQGSIYSLDGYDDQCGAGQRASVVGTAFSNPDGTIGMGLNTVLSPGGGFVHIDARISLATLGGSWQDSGGRSGTFTFTSGAGGGGQPRPNAAAAALGYQIVETDAVPVAAGERTSRTATCPPGKKVIAGGSISSSSRSVVQDSRPISDGTGWTVAIWNTGADPGNFVVSAICAAVQ